MISDDPINGDNLSVALLIMQISYSQNMLGVINSHKKMFCDGCCDKNGSTLGKKRIMEIATWGQTTITVDDKLLEYG